MDNTEIWIKLFLLKFSDIDESIVVGSSPSRSDNVIKETGVFQTNSIAFSRFSNFHREFSNFPIAFCNVFSKINLINNNNNLRITNAAKTFNIDESLIFLNIADKKLDWTVLYSDSRFYIFCYTFIKIFFFIETFTIEDGFIIFNFLTTICMVISLFKVQLIF
jgi:hypothetical protein